MNRSRWRGRACSRARGARASTAACMVGTAVYQVGLELGEPLEEPQLVEARACRRPLAPASSEASSAGDQAVDVEERHDVQAPVVGASRGRRDVAGRAHEVAVRQRDELRPGRRSRGVQQERDVVGIGRRPVPGSRASPREAEDTGGVARIDIQLHDLDAPLGGDCPRGGVERGADHERVRPEIVEIERELLCPVRRVERSDRGGPTRSRGTRVAASGPFSTRRATRLAAPRPCALSWPAIVDVTSSRPS